MKNKYLKNNKAITLIALVVTIIVLLILAGISIQMILDNDGIIQHAEDVKIETRGATVEEERNLWRVEKVYDEYKNVKTAKTLEELIQDLVDRNLLTEDEKDIILGNEEKGIEATGKVTIGSRTIEFAVKSPTQGSITDIYDSTGTGEGLHIGDFINYDAGTWTDEDITAIENTGSKQSVSTGNPSNSFQFGKLTSGNSRNESVATNSTTYSYVKDESGNAVKGWRIFDINGDTVTLISAGCTESYLHAKSCGSNTRNGYVSEYILTGNINSTADATALSLMSTCTKRDFSMYEQGIGTNARTITKAILDDWYTKYMEFESADIYESETFKSIYGTKYESLIDIYAEYWLGTQKTTYVDDLLYIGGYWQFSSVSCSSSSKGIRMLVDIPASVICTLEGTKTITSRDVDYIYNVWDI